MNILDIHTEATQAAKKAVGKCWLQEELQTKDNDHVGSCKAQWTEHGL